MVGSVVQAVAVLRHLGGLERGRGVTAIASDLGISPSSCFNVLRTLTAEGLVEFDPSAKTYQLGAGAIDIARKAIARDPVLAAAQRGMTALSERYDAAVGLWRVSGERLILVALAESAAATRLHMVIGQRQPCYAGAAGRAVAAARGLTREALSACFASLRWQSAPSAQAYADQVAQASQGGFAVDRDQILRGVTSVAAAMADGDGAVSHALSLSTFSGRHPPAALPEIGRALHALAETAAQR